MQLVEITIAAVDPTTQRAYTDHFQCLGEAFQPGSMRYWNYNDTGTPETGNMVLLDYLQVEDPAYLDAYLIVSENDDHTCAAGYLPSVFDWNRDWGNDDELVGIWRVANLRANLGFYYPNSTNPVVHLWVERP